MYTNTEESDFNKSPDQRESFQLNPTSQNYEKNCKDTAYQLIRL